MMSATRRSSRAVTAILMGFVILAGACSPDATQAPASQGQASQGQASQAPASRDTLIIGIASLPPGIDPDQTSNSPLLAQLFSQMGMAFTQASYEKQQPVADPNKVPGFFVTSNDLSNLQPRLIDSCTLAPDGSTVTMKIHPGSKSPVGNELKSADILWAVERTLALESTGNFFLGVANAQDLAQWAAADDYTVVVTRKGDDEMVNLCGLTSHQTVAPTFLLDSTEFKKHVTADDPWAKGWAMQNGSWHGPYYVASWEAGKQAVFEANPYWTFTDLKIKKIIYQVVPESSARISLLKAGKLDLIEGISPEEAVALDGEPGVRPVAVQSNVQLLIIWDSSNPPFNDVRVRQAFSRTLDRVSIANTIYKGLAEPYQGIIPTNFPGFKAYNNYDFDLERAKQELADAGFKPDDPPLVLNYEQGKPVFEQVAIAWQSELAKVGVTLNLKKVPFSVLDPLMFAREKPPGWMTFFADGPQQPDVGFATNLWYKSPSSTNFSNFFDDTFNQMSAECGRVLVETDRIPCYQGMMDHLSANEPFPYIVAPFYIYAVSDKVSGANYVPGFSYWVPTMSVQE